MARIFEYGGDRTGLNHGAAIHDAQIVTELGDQTEMMRNENDRTGEALTQIFEQIVQASRAGGGGAGRLPAAQERCDGYFLKLLKP